MTYLLFIDTFQEYVESIDTSTQYVDIFPFYRHMPSLYLLFIHRPRYSRSYGIRPITVPSIYSSALIYNELCDRQTTGLRQYRDL